MRKPIKKITKIIKMVLFCNHAIWSENVPPLSKFQPIVGCKEVQFNKVVFSNELTLKEMVLDKNIKYGEVFMVAIS